MAIVMLMEWPRVTLDEYDRVMEALKLDERAPEGAVFHFAGSEGGSLRVVDIWESEDAWNSFRETRLMPALQETGLIEKGAPNVRTYDVHNVYAPRPEEIDRLSGRSALAGARA
jgi:hypothetical protein